MNCYPLNETRLLLNEIAKISSTTFSHYMIDLLGMYVLLFSGKRVIPSKLFLCCRGNHFFQMSSNSVSHLVTNVTITS